MIKYFVIAILVILFTICSLAYAICYTKLKDIKKRITRAEKEIDETLKYKEESINNLNKLVTELLKNDKYLEEYANLESQNLTKIEKDIKLNEAYKVIKKLYDDNIELHQQDFTDNYRKLKINEEKLISAKILYNKNVEASNKLIRKFPYGIIAKINKIRIRAFFNINKKTDM